MQMDVSHRRSCEDRSEETIWLMNIVDDATKTVYAFPAKRETTEAAMRLL
jgi:hypothetical protein